MLSYYKIVIQTLIEFNKGGTTHLLLDLTLNKSKKYIYIDIDL